MEDQNQLLMDFLKDFLDSGIRTEDIIRRWNNRDGLGALLYTNCRFIHNVFGIKANPGVGSNPCIYLSKTFYNDGKYEASRPLWIYSDNSIRHMDF
jgi:hypothetical protein